MRWGAARGGRGVVGGARSPRPLVASIMGLRVAIRHACGVTSLRRGAGGADLPLHTPPPARAMLARHGRAPLRRAHIFDDATKRDPVLGAVHRDGGVILR